ncbi:MAG: hypothetical protein IPO00_04995 [Betaproteobacteria bacterium]|nr:hypothetical protein [Betaproteobacteria bacterium]
MKTLYEKAKNRLRSLFNIRRKRRSPPVGTKPAVNACICRGTVKMQVTHEIDSSLWQWLALQGWRKITVPNDRRRYRNLPKEAMKILIKASPEALDPIHGRMLAAAAKAKASSAKSPRAKRSATVAKVEKRIESKDRGAVLPAPSVAD